jgi:hypothetical protein
VLFRSVIAFFHHGETTSIDGNGGPDA